MVAPITFHVLDIQCVELGCNLFSACHLALYVTGNVLMLYYTKFCSSMLLSSDKRNNTKIQRLICSTPKMKNMTSSCSLSCTKMDMILLNNAFTKENVLWAVFRFFQYSSVLKSLRISPRLRLKLYFTSKICFLASFCRGTVQFVILLPPWPVSFAWFKLMFICC